MAKPDGGPAFPQSIFHDEIAGNDSFVETSGGMTLRDYFAAKAMSALVSVASFSQGESSVRIDAARCYRMADAMLAEREQ